jgi:hypothetical protein
MIGDESELLSSKPLGALVSFYISIDRVFIRGMPKLPKGKGYD